MEYLTYPFPSPGQLKKNLALSPLCEKFLYTSREQAKAVFTGKTEKKVLVMGPCSIHEKESALEYAKRSIELQKEVKDQFFIIMRVYCEKPRTALSWKGYLYDPHLDDSNNLEEGIFLARSLLLELAELGIPCATEFLDPLIAPYIEDLITWGFIGARTVKSQIHRQFISKFSYPIGVKNALDGNVLPSIKATLFANHPQTFLSLDDNGRVSLTRTNGNPYVHPVLRGSLDLPNYDRESIFETFDLLSKHHLPPKILIDCSHGNSQEDFNKQKEVFSYLVHEMKNGLNIMGMMLESHLFEGSQILSSSHLQYGISITDPCLGWDDTYQLIKESSLLL